MGNISKNAKNAKNKNAATIGITAFWCTRGDSNTRRTV